MRNFYSVFHYFSLEVIKIPSTPEGWLIYWRHNFFCLWVSLALYETMTIIHRTDHETVGHNFSSYGLFDCHYGSHDLHADPDHKLTRKRLVFKAIEQIICTPAQLSQSVNFNVIHDSILGNRSLIGNSIQRLIVFNRIEPMLSYQYRVVPTFL